MVIKQALIDIGSNSMRLTVYETDGAGFRTLFKGKIMAGLAGYVEGGALSSEGIECACNGLLKFRGVLESLHIGNVAVFATASLRNVKNSGEAAAAIKTVTGFDVEILSGEEEALYGYAGAMQEVRLPCGAYVDIGGASTEVVSFADGRVIAEASFAVGSLRLYKECVRKILPGEGAVKRIQGTIVSGIDQTSAFPFEKRTPLVCVGGTARAVMKIARKVYGLPGASRTLSSAQLSDLCALLRRGDRAAAELILKLEPERIHTLVPGSMILEHICGLFASEEIIVSKYGVREGYLCQKIWKRNGESMSTPKTES